MYKLESRTIYFENKEDLNSEIGALIPLLDFANHSFLNVDHFKYFYYDKDN